MHPWKQGEITPKKVLKNFIARGWAGRIMYFFGMVMFIHSNILIDGACRHHQNLGLSGTALVLWSGRFRRKKPRTCFLKSGVFTFFLF